jgi:adenylate kinase
MSRTFLHGKPFEPFISAAEVEQAIAKLAREVERDFRDKRPLFLGVLNGSYYFAAELLKRLSMPCEISFVKLASYHGTVSSGTVSQLIGLNEPVAGRHVVVLEDIVDTGHTIVHIMAALQEQRPASVSIAAMLLKPEAYQKDIPIRYVALEIPDRFVVGSGLDHDGLGRNLPGVHRLAETDMNEKIHLVLFGPPGAGKGTQSEFLKERYGLEHLSTGDLLRAEITAGSPLGLKAKALMDAGELVPDEVVVGMIRNMLEQRPDAKGFIFDGFPRTQAQAEALDKTLAEVGGSIRLMLALDAPEEELVKRLLGRGATSGRADDQNEEVVRRRIREYEQKTAPLKAYYAAQGKFRPIHGTGSIAEITARLAQAIDG